MPGEVARLPHALWSVEVERSPLLLFVYANVLNGSVVHRSFYGLTKRGVRRRAERWIIHARSDEPRVAVRHPLKVPEGKGFLAPTEPCHDCTYAKQIAADLQHENERLRAQIAEHQRCRECRASVRVSDDHPSRFCPSCGDRLPDPDCWCEETGIRDDGRGPCPMCQPEAAAALCCRTGGAMTTPDSAAMTGADLIEAERKRQIEQEGWSIEHDRQHGVRRLVAAAHAYEFENPQRWPFEPESYKPKGALRNLVRAGALYWAAGDIGDLPAAAQGRMRCAEKIDLLLAEAKAVLYGD